MLHGVIVTLTLKPSAEKEHHCVFMMAAAFLFLYDALLSMFIDVMTPYHVNHISKSV